ncbi:MAG: HEPN domain-containing protein [Roseibium sp.]|uniref:HEPN domain-containing protein n=1 Tax=Roseibium sp. TaxID=1936156 RepID=UPI001B2C38E4|nr:HEPN domain-containing protein [Roseibium sp.]MBO6895225.1 HEPN domain-containing protein [Roseibium sp.]MBO6930735.1 HEPN domain-containing protein [Roseibium sp.]
MAANGPKMYSNDPTDLYLWAQNFAETSLLCAQQQARGVAGDPFIVSGFTNAALALELYLKAMIMQERGSFPAIHEIDRLVDYLTQDTRLDLKERYEKPSRRTLNDRNAREKLGIVNANFEQALKLSRNFYLTMRYPPARGKRKIQQFDPYLIHVTRELLLIRNPSWERKFNVVPYD